MNILIKYYRFLSFCFIFFADWTLAFNALLFLTACFSTCLMFLVYCGAPVLRMRFAIADDMMDQVASKWWYVVCTHYTGEGSIEAEIEADSNDITEYPQDERPTIGMLGLGFSAFTYPCTMFYCLF